MKLWNIIILDDEDIYHKILRIMLRKVDHNIIHCSTFEQVEEFFKFHPKNNILITDYHLKGHTGANYIEKLKEDGYDVNFIAITSSKNDAIRKQMMDLGAIRFFLKDDNFIKDLKITLEEVIKELIKEKKSKSSQVALS